VKRVTAGCLVSLLCTLPVLVAALPIELHREELPPCSRTSWRQQKILGIVVTKVPVQEWAPQRRFLRADIKGDGVDSAEFAPLVASCTRSAASDVGLEILINAPKENVDFMEKLVNACTARELRAAGHPTSRVRVTSIALAVETKCELRK
jgi:hypothetical protein